MKKSITIGAFTLVLAFVGYTYAVPSEKPFQQLLALINDLDTRVTNLEASGGGGGGGLFHSYIGGLRAREINYVTENNRTLVEVERSYPIPRTGRLVSLAVHPTVNTLDATAIFTVRVNGADTTLQLNVPAGSTAGQTVVSNVNVTAGDLVALEIDTTLAIDPERNQTVGFLATFEYLVD